MCILAIRSEFDFVFLVSHFLPTKLISPGVCSFCEILEVFPVSVLKFSALSGKNDR